MDIFELQHELDGLVNEQEAYLMEGNHGAAEELIPEIDELCAQIDALESAAYA